MRASPPRRPAFRTTRTPCSPTHIPALIPPPLPRAARSPVVPSTTPRRLLVPSLRTKASTSTPTFAADGSGFLIRPAKRTVRSPAALSSRWISRSMTTAASITSTEARVRCRVPCVRYARLEARHRAKDVEGRGLTAPALPYALIHRSAWNMNSRKLAGLGKPPYAGKRPSRAWVSAHPTTRGVIRVNELAVHELLHGARQPALEVQHLRPFRRDRDARHPLVERAHLRLERPKLLLVFHDLPRRVQELGGHAVDDLHARRAAH